MNMCINQNYVFTNIFIKILTVTALFQKKKNVNAYARERLSIGDRIK